MIMDFGIEQALEQLGLKEMNAGTSTGSDNFANGEVIASYSPVDGSLIGKVKTTRTTYGSARIGRRDQSLAGRAASADAETVDRAGGVVVAAIR